MLAKILISSSSSRPFDLSLSLYNMQKHKEEIHYSAQHRAAADMTAQFNMQEKPQRSSISMNTNGERERERPAGVKP